MTLSLVLGCANQMTGLRREISSLRSPLSFPRQIVTPRRNDTPVKIAGPVDSSESLEFRPAVPTTMFSRDPYKRSRSIPSRPATISRTSGRSVSPEHLFAIKYFVHRRKGSWH